MRWGEKIRRKSVVRAIKAPFPPVCHELNFIFKLNFGEKSEERSQRSPVVSGTAKTR